MATAPGPESNLRTSYDRFRSYDDSPWTDEIRYFGEPREHWCYIGEIVDDVSLGRLCVSVRDVEGAICTVAFYTDDAGQSFRESCVKGNTLVILYAKQYQFMDGRTGFRVEQQDVPFVKAFDVRFKSLLEFNDKVHAGSYADKCGSCESRNMTEQCSACHIIPYCNRRCQVAAWRSPNTPGGHKKECQILQILSWFTSKDWTKFNGKFRFT